MITKNAAKIIIRHLPERSEKLQVYMNLLCPFDTLDILSFNTTAVI
jgi:hypothetical protein